LTNAELLSKGLRALFRDWRLPGCSLRSLVSPRFIFDQWLGAGTGVFPPRPAAPHLISTFIASFCGIAIVAALHYHAAAVSGFGAPPYAWQWMIGSFGATAVLLYATPESPLAQPRNLLFGHVGSALIGATINVLLPGESTRWLACALAVSLSISYMQAARVVHPPGMLVI
jgi:CBS-domain-containing membrane protein